MQHKRTINSKQLTILMVVLIGGPIGCGLLLSFFTPKMPEPSLPALVKLDAIWIPPDESAEARRLVPCITVKNPTKSAWRNVSIGLNSQFYAQKPKGIPAGETISVPLEVFVARTGSVTFPGGNREVKVVTVFAQVESGARAVSEHKMPAIIAVRKDADGSDAGWIAGD